MQNDDVRTARSAVASFEGDRGGQTYAEMVKGFVAKYGWRAYALPVLIIVTVAALANLAGSGTTKQPATHRTTPAAALPPVVPASHPPTAATTTSHAPTAGSGDTSIALSSDALPAGAKYTTQGAGTFTILPGTGPIVGDAATVRRYSIDVEDGITGINLTQFAAVVQQTLSDPRSWVGHGVALQRVDTGPIDFHVTLTSSMTVRELCGYDQKIETSCFAASGSVAGLAVNRVVLNDARWVRGDVSYAGNLAGYREYMVNHEDGHALGHQHAHSCLSDGLAPVMMQQTIGLKSAVTGQMCRANPWPYPAGATDAPGAEQADTAANAPITTKTSAHTG